MSPELVDELVDDDVEDLAQIAAAHPVEHKRIDLSRINVAEVLSLGDIADMARELDADPDKLGAVLSRGNGYPLEVAVVLAWILGRKGDASLSLDHVRRFWQIELVGVGTTRPGPTKATTTRSRGRAGSSRKRG